MTSETRRINNQLKCAYQDEAWHGPSLRELLDGVTAEQAAACPIANAHSIWEIVLHIIAWEGMARRRLEGETLTAIPDQMDFPPVADSSERSWQASLQSLAESNQALRDAIERIDDSRLDELVPGMNYSNHFMLHLATAICMMRKIPIANYH